MPGAKHSRTALSSNSEKAEMLLKQYEQMITIAGDMIYTTDARGYCTHVSQSVEDVLGYSPAEVTGVHFSELVHPDWKKLVTEFYHRQFSRLSPQSTLEFAMQTRSGKICKVDQVVALIVENGKVMGFHAFVRNITPYKQIEEQLGETADHFFAVAQNAHVALFVMRNGQLAYANRALENLLGYDNGVLMDTNILDHIHPDSRALVENALQIQRSDKGRNTRQEIRLEPEKHGERWIDLATSPILFEDQPAIVGTAFDITDRKKAEEERENYIKRLEVIQNVDSELTKLLKFDYVLKIALDAAVEITKAHAGAIHLVEGDGMHVAQVIGDFPNSMIGSHVAIDKGIVGRVFRTRQAELVSDVQNDPDYVRNIIDTRAQMTIPLIVQNRLIGVLNVQTAEPGIFTTNQFDFLKTLTARIASALENARLYDTSQSHLSEVQELYEQVSALEQMKTQMIRIAAHDLRNPLGVISGYLQMVGWDNDATLNERSREHLSIIQEAVGRIDKITRDILTLERVSARQEAPNEIVDLCDVVTATAKEFRIQADEKSLQYHLELPQSNVTVRGDRILLHETVGNLISNAIKYTPEKGAVWVRLSPSRTGDSVVFEVQDTGYGIPEDQQEDLFKPFYRVKLKETRSVKGTGLGLHLVKNIIEQHQGRMHFSSTYEQGSTFGFELPLAGKTKRRPRKTSITPQN